MKALLCLLMLLVAAHAPAETVKLIVTANLERIFPVLSDDPAYTDIELKFEKVLNGLRDDEPDAFLIDAGRHQSITHTNETGYNVPVWQFHDYLKYDAVNLDTREGMTSTEDVFGFQVAPESFRGRLVAAAISSREPMIQLPSTRRVTHGGTTIAFTSLANMAAAKVMGVRSAYTVRKPDEALLAEIASANQDQAITVGFGSGKDYLPAFPDAASTPDVVLQLGESDATVIEGTAPGGKFWAVAAPSPGDILLLTLEVEAGKVTARPETKLVSYLAKDLRPGLIKYPTPKVGVLVPNLEHTLGQFFDSSRGAASLDRFPLDKVAEFSLQAPNVYIVPTEKGPQRLYRVQAFMPYYRFAGVMDPNWPQMDILVVLAEDHRFLRVISRTEFPIASTNSVLLEDFNRRTGTDPDSWTFDPSTCSGGEEVWNWITDAVRKTVAVDKRLFPDE